MKTGFSPSHKVHAKKKCNDRLQQVTWIRIDRMRIQIHKMCWMQFRIQDNKIT